MYYRQRSNKSVINDSVGVYSRSDNNWKNIPPHSRVSTLIYYSIFDEITDIQKH